MSKNSATRLGRRAYQVYAESCARSNVACQKVKYTNECWLQTYSRLACRVDVILESISGVVWRTAGHIP